MPFFFKPEFATNPFYRSRALAHEVPIATIRDNLYVLTDYTLVGVWRIRGLEYALAGERDMLQFTQALKFLVNNLPPEVDMKVLHRVHYNYRPLLNEHLALLKSDNVFARYLAWDQAKRYNTLMKQGELLASENIITISFKPKIKWWKMGFSPKNILTHLDELAGAPGSGGKSLREYRMMLRMYEDLVRPIEQVMQSANLSPSRLRTTELYELAWEILNPEVSTRHPMPSIRLPSPRDPSAGVLATPAGKKAVKRRPDAGVVAPLSEREQLTHTDWLIRDKYVRIGDLYYGVVALKKLPSHVAPGIAAKLTAMPFQSTLVYDLKMLEKRAELEKQWSRTKTAKSMATATMFGGTPDPLDLERAQQMEQAYRELSSPDENMFQMRMLVTVTGRSPDELDANCDTVIQEIRSMESATAIRERYGIESLIKLSWPFSLPATMNSVRAKSSTVSCLMPLYDNWSGSKRPVALMLDPMNRLIKLDPFPLNLPAKNRVITGSTGTGKSFMAQLALIQPFAALPNSEILIIDSGGSFEFTTRTFGGVNVRLGPKTKYRINAFDLPKNFDSLPPASQKEELDFKYLFLTKLILTMVDLPDRAAEKLAESVIGVVAQSTYQSNKAPRFGDFYRELGRYRNAEDIEAQTTAARLRTLLRNYVINEDGVPGTYSTYFDCETNFDVSSSIICFDLIDIKGTPSLLAPMMMVTLMGLFYNRIMSRDGKDRLVIVDEAHALVKPGPGGVETPAGSAITLFWREGRKMNASSTLISQNLSDLSEDEVGRAVLTNTQINFFLRHERPGNEQAFRDANYSEAVREAIFGLETVKGQYSSVLVREDKGMGTIRLPSPPLRYWLASTDPEDIKVRNRYIAKYHDGYNFPIEVVVALLAHDYPSGASGPHDSEMSESEALAYAERFADHLRRFGDIVRKGAVVPLDFQ